MDVRHPKACCVKWMATEVQLCSVHLHVSLDCEQRNRLLVQGS